jgi:hypothetical protein
VKSTFGRVLTPTGLLGHITSLAPTPWHTANARFSAHRYDRTDSGMVAGRA